MEKEHRTFVDLYNLPGTHEIVKVLTRQTPTDMAFRGDSRSCERRVVGRAQLSRHALNKSEKLHFGVLWNHNASNDDTGATLRRARPIASSSDYPP